MRIHGPNGWLDLSPNDLLAQGGEGAVYVRDGYAYKIYHDAAKCIEQQKIYELVRIFDHRVIVPLGLVKNTKGKPVGYYMKHIADGQHLAPLFTRAYCQRKRVTRAQKLHIVERLRDLVANVHKAGVLIVDLNELNFLLTPKLDDVWAIDVDSYQTRHYPATAIMETVRDRHVLRKPAVQYMSPIGHAPSRFVGVFGSPEWTEGSDWFSFGVLACQVFTGVHPYKGRHPTCHADNPEQRLEERMQKNLSIFRPGVVLPPTAYSLADIPDFWRGWFVSVFDQGARTDPHTATVVAAPAPMPVATPTMASGRLFDMQLILSQCGDVLGVMHAQEGLVVLSTAGLFVDGENVFTNMPQDSVLCVAGTCPCYAYLEKGQVIVRCCGPKSPLFQGEADDLTTSEGRLYLRRGEHLLEVIWADTWNAIPQLAAPKIVGSVLPNATKLYPGCAIQQVFAVWYATLLNEVPMQVQLPECQGKQIMDAYYENGFLAIITADRRTGQHDRLLYRFDATNGHVCDTIPNVGNVGLSITVLDKGLCLLMDEEGKIHAIPRTGPGVILDDPVVYGGELHHDGDRALLAKGNRLFSISRKP